MQRRRPIENNMQQDRWLVSYADFITLLFAFFVVMYSASHVSEVKYKELSGVLEEVFANMDDEPSTSVERPATPVEPPSLSDPAPHFSFLEQVENNIVEALADFISSNDAIVQATESWVEVELNANSLFDSGSALPTARAQYAFARLAGLLSTLSNEVSVAGHTDDQPISTSEFMNNWQLSAARALQVVNLLVAEGVAPQRLSAIGYGEFRPIADNSTEAGRARNRRVVLRVSKHAPKKMPAQGATRAPNAATTPRVDPVRLRNGGLLFTSEPDN